MYNIETLGKLCGLSRRAIRYYIQRELLPPPEGGGRGSYYTDDHLSRLKRIKQWSEQGMPLFHMKAILDGKIAESEADDYNTPVVSPEMFLYKHINIDEGLILVVREGKLSHSQIKRIDEAIKTIIHKESL